MVYCGPVDDGDPTLKRHAEIQRWAASLDELDDPEYEWVREQMAAVGVDLPAVRLRPDPRIVQTFEA
jgi:hypothetical protein